MSDTHITNTNPPNGNSIGWALTFILVLIVFIGGVVMYQKGFFNKPTPEKEEASINVTIPVSEKSDSEGTSE